MGSFVLRLDTAGTGLRVAVKDVIDLAGTPTTAGCRVVAATAGAATADAACLAGLRRAEGRGDARTVGKTGLHELALGVTGLNPWFASPSNPLDPNRVVGGSSSGSAAAVGAGEADVAFGTDTGGSVRIPAACCGVVGLKTTAGRVPLDGVRPLAPSLDTVGPLAATVAGVVAGMALLEPGFEPAPAAAGVLGRVRLAATREVDAAVDDALAVTGIEVREIALDGWAGALVAGMDVLGAEAWASWGHLCATGGLGPDVAERLRQGAEVTPARLAAARAVGQWWAGVAAAALAELGPGGLLAMPTLSHPVPVISEAATVTAIRHTVPWNLAGWPAVALPVPLAGSHVPTSLQLVGGAGAEELLVATAASVEAAVT